MNSYKTYRKNISSQLKGIAVLIDPEKFHQNHDSLHLLDELSTSGIGCVLVGGSTCSREEFDACIAMVKQRTSLPVILFPGSSIQISNLADGILFLSLLSGRNPEYLIGQQINAAEEVAYSGLEVIPTAYLLIDGGKETSVQRTSKTIPIDRGDTSLIVRTVLAAKHLGFQHVYLDAGSGANQAVPPTVISKVKEIGLPIIVGGGVRSLAQISEYHEAGANLVVIGSHLEENPTFIKDLIAYQHHS